MLIRKCNTCTNLLKTATICIFINDLTAHVRYLTFRIIRWLDAKLEFCDGVEALPEMGLYSQGVPGLSQDLEQLVIGQEVESGMKFNSNSTAN